MAKRKGVCLLLSAAFWPLALGARGQDANPRVVFLISNIECAQCAKVVTASLRELDGVSAAAVSAQTRRAVVAFDPKQVTVQQLADAVATTRPLRGKPYAAGLLIHVEPLAPATTARLTAACRTLKGLTRCEVVDARSGTVAVYFAPLPANGEANGPSGIREDAVMQALRGAGVTARLVAPEKP